MSGLVSALVLCHILWWWEGEVCVSWWVWSSQESGGFCVRSWSLRFGLCPYLCVSGIEGVWLGGGFLSLLSLPACCWGFELSGRGGGVVLCGEICVKPHCWSKMTLFFLFSFGKPMWMVFFSAVDFLGRGIGVG